MVDTNKNNSGFFSSIVLDAEETQIDEFIEFWQSEEPFAKSRLRDLWFACQNKNYSQKLQAFTNLFNR